MKKFFVEVVLEEVLFYWIEVVRKGILDKSLFKEVDMKSRMWGLRWVDVEWEFFVKIRWG